MPEIERVLYSGYIAEGELLGALKMDCVTS
jgi:hypothetical protein